MEQDNALLAFSALSQSTRLEVFRLLMTHEPEGLAAGEIARHLDVPANTLSSHLGVLSRAGLVASERQSRMIIYRARICQINALVGFMVHTCCQGNHKACDLQFPTATASASDNVPVT